MARIRIKSGPRNSSVPGQMSSSFDGRDLQKPSTSTARQLKAVPRDEANIEAERGETALVPDKNGLPAHYSIGGARHTGGGTPLNVPKDTFIFSDTKKMRIKDPMILAEFGKAKGSYTPAELAKKYDINKFRKILGDPDSDHLDVDTAEKMIANYNLKLGKLALVQESKKGFPQGIPAVAMPYLSTFNIEPDNILPLKAEEEMGQEGPPQGMPMAKYGRTLKRYQGLFGGSQVTNDPSYMQPPGTSLGPLYEDLTKSADWNNMSGPPSSSAGTNPGQGTTMNLPPQGGATENNWNQTMTPQPPAPATPTAQGQFANPITTDTKQQNQPNAPSIYSKGTAKTGIKMYGEEAANWGIAGGNLLTNIFSQDEKRNAEKQLASRFKAENIFASRGDKDRGDYTTNYGYFRPDDQNVGNMVTGAYGGQLPMAQDGLWKYGPVSQRDSVENMARNQMRWEHVRGNRDGTGLSSYGNPGYAEQLKRNPTEDEAVNWYMQNIYPQVKDKYPTAMEQVIGGDMIYNSGKNAFNYLNWDTRKDDVASQQNWDEVTRTMSTDARRKALNNARDKFYKNRAPKDYKDPNTGKVISYDYGKNAQGEFNKDKHGAISPAYENTWYGRQHASDQYRPYTEADFTNPDIKDASGNPLFYKKQYGGYMQDGGNVQARMTEINRKIALAKNLDKSPTEYLTSVEKQLYAQMQTGAVSIEDDESFLEEIWPYAATTPDIFYPSGKYIAKKAGKLIGKYAPYVKPYIDAAARKAEEAYRFAAYKLRKLPKYIKENPGKAFTATAPVRLLGTYFATKDDPSYAIPPPMPTTSDMAPVITVPKPMPKPKASVKPVAKPNQAAAQVITIDFLNQLPDARRKEVLDSLAVNDDALLQSLYEQAD